MQTDKIFHIFSENNNNIILLRSYLNLISIIACSKMVHNITQTKFKLLVYDESSCTKIIQQIHENPKAILLFP